MEQKYTMKTTTKYKDYTFDKDGNIVLSLTIDRRYLEQVHKFSLENDDKIYNLVIKDRAAQRTERQNSAVWKLITEINKVEHGESNKDLNNELYCNMIKFSSIELEYYETLEGAQSSLESVYRVVEPIERRLSKKGKETVVFACYKGLSRFTKEENNQFIKTLLDYSGKLCLGVTLETEELKSLLREK